MRARTLAALVVLVVAGCSAEQPAPKATPDLVGPATTLDVGPGFVPDVASQEGSQQAMQVAVAAMGAFVRRDLPYEQWWAGLSPMLSMSAAAAFAFTDPARVPASVVTDTGVVSAAPDATSITVLVGTDVGQYRLELAREGAGAPWLVEAIVPPVGVA